MSGDEKVEDSMSEDSSTASEVEMVEQEEIKEDGIPTEELSIFDVIFMVVLFNDSTDKQSLFHSSFLATV